MKVEYVDYMGDDFSVVNVVWVLFDKVSEWVVDYDKVLCGIE